MRGVIGCILVMSAVLGSAENGQAWDLPYDVDLVSIQFNHDPGGISEDAITTSSGGAIVNYPEWNAYPARNLSFAYLGAQNPKVKAVFYSSTVANLPPTMRILPFLNTGQILWELAEKEVSSSIFDGNGYSSPEEFSTVPGSGLPSGTVRRALVSWSWRITMSFGEPESPSILIGSTQHTFYILRVSPIQPMSTPWIEVLNYACEWANGTSTEDNCRNALITGLNSFGVYDMQYSRSTNGSLNLSQLLQNFNSTKAMNCEDFANYANVLAASLGISCTWRREETDFTTHKILAADTSDADDNWFSKDWNFHQISSAVNSNVIDASGRVDGDSSPDINPPRLTTLPSGNMTFSTWLSKYTPATRQFSTSGYTTAY